MNRALIGLLCVCLMCSGCAPKPPTAAPQVLIQKPAEPSFTEQLNAQYERERSACRERIGNNKIKIASLTDEYYAIKPSQFTNTYAVNNYGVRTICVTENSAVSNRMRQIESEVLGLTQQINRDEEVIRRNATAYESR